MWVQLIRHLVYFIVQLSDGDDWRVRRLISRGLLAVLSGGFALCLLSRTVRVLCRESELEWRAENRIANPLEMVWSIRARGWQRSKWHPLMAYTDPIAQTGSFAIKYARALEDGFWFVVSVSRNSALSESNFVRPIVRASCIYYSRAHRETRAE